MAEIDGRVIMGLDTHKRFHTVAVVDSAGRELAARDFPACAAGYAEALGWARGFGEVARAGVEGTGSYGAGASAFLSGHGVEVLDVYKPDRQERRRRGKDNVRDAFEAAAAALSRRRCAPAKENGELMQALQLLKSAYDQAVRQRTAALNALGADVVRLPDAMRAPLGGLSGLALAKACAPFRVPEGAMGIAPGAKAAMRSLARRALALDAEAKALDREVERYASALAPRTMALAGIGHHGAANLLCAAGENIGRLRGEASFAMLCGVAPVPASTGDRHHFRLNRAGSRKANNAIYNMAITRMGKDEETRAFIDRKMGENKTKKDAIRSLKRYLAREAYGALKADLEDLGLMREGGAAA